MWRTDTYWFDVALATSRIIAGGQWGAFGYIAAERELAWWRDAR